MNKFCMVIAGRDETVKKACGTMDKLGFISDNKEAGFYSFHGSRNTMPDIVIMDVGAFDKQTLTEKLEALDRLRHVTVFCATPEDKADLQEALEQFPVNLAMRPFEMCEEILS